MDYTNVGMSDDPSTYTSTEPDHTGGDWCNYWRSMANLRWSELDRDVLRVVGNFLGWGPQRSLCELGAGRGQHSRMLYYAGRCESLITVVDPSPTARCLAARNGNVPYQSVDLMPKGSRFDIAWSSGLVEHFSGAARQAIVDQHFELAKEEVIIVVPVINLQRRIFPPKDSTPWTRLYTVRELLERMATAERKVWEQESNTFAYRFAPLFGVRHLPDALYPALDRLARPLFRGGLAVGVARKGGHRGE